MTAAMLFAETAIRGAAAALLLLLIALALPQARRSPGARYGALFALCGVGYLADSAPVLAGIRMPWLLPAQMLSATTPGVFWVWAAANFDDDFTPAWKNWLPWAGLLLLHIAALLIDRRAAWLILQVAALIVVGLGLWRILAGAGGDLVESRRRMRTVLSLAAALSIVGLTGLEFFQHSRTDPALNAILAGGLALLAFSFVLLRLTPPEIAASPAAAGTPAALVTPASASPPDAEEAALLARLMRLMDHDKVYREEGLSVAALANRVGVPEYRLRRLINQRLGHRNFTSFVNLYRLAETKAALADPQQARVPVLTIALDAGFQSIGPFNRAFKADTGMTPSEYRRERLAAHRSTAAD